MKYGEYEMTSAELNAYISEHDGDDSPIYQSTLGEKLVPYIGWFWRTVDFDSKTYAFGVIPTETPFATISHYENGKWVETKIGPFSKEAKVGFMENNKWDYSYVRADETAWENIKRLLVTACKTSDADYFRQADEAIQALAVGQHFV